MYRAPSNSSPNSTTLTCRLITLSQHHIGMLHLWRGGHGSSPNSPHPSKASPPPLAQSISEHFRLASDPPGLSAYFSSSLMDSRMTLVCSYHLSLLDTLNSSYLHFDPQPSTLTSASHSQLSDSVSDSCIDFSCWHGGNSSAWSLIITTVSGMFPAVSFPCLCYRTEDYHCVSVSHLFGSPLS